MEGIPFNLLILPLVAGYYLVTRLEQLKYINQRLSSQAVIFNSILVGIPLLVGGLIVSAGLSILFPVQVDYIKANIFPIKDQYFGTCLLSLMIAFFVVTIWNRWVKEPQAIQRAIDKIGNELELLFSKSFYDNELIQITLKNDKVYIGWVEAIPKPTEYPYVRIIPLISGHRNSEDKELKLTTDYSVVYNEYIKKGKIKDISELDMNLVIQVTEIITATRFDFDIYEQFSLRRKGKGSKTP